MIVRALLLSTALCTLSGCVATAVGAAGAVGVAAMQDRTIGQGLDDANASNELKTKLMAAGPERFAEVDVEVANRTVLLTGRVDSQQDRIEAEQAAWTVRLVEEVANEIQIREKGGVRQNLNDEWITAQVRSRMFTDGAVKSLNINIETYDGTVYLMGIARSQYELNRATEHASLVRGVKEVVSYIHLREPETRTQPPTTATNTAPTETIESTTPVERGDSTYVPR
ncbi:BON domain-containing protein [Ponticaulis profundi]|uniref:BON domain-containing protein n=1 Tax=Ponticaulis profundi TaxID=2665222 RepID=A0ABW1S976_9PROT